jgi:hypothetical protein
MGQKAEENNWVSYKSFCYSHVVVRATVTRVGSHEILPLDAEEGRNEDGQ